MSEQEKQTFSLFSEFGPVSRDEWERVITKELRGADYREKLRWETGEGIDVMPFYRREDLRQPLPAIPFLSKKGNSWKVVQPVYAVEPAEANKEALEAIKNGTEGLQIGVELFPSDGLLGGDIRGADIESLQDFELLFRDIPLNETFLFFDTGPASPAYLSMLNSMKKTREVADDEVAANFIYDPYSHYARYGRLHKPEPDFLKDARHTIQYCREHLPAVRFPGVDLRLYHNAGGSIIQELAIALATGNEWIARLTDLEIPAGVVASHIHFTFAVGSNYFPEIAKLRAFRLLWEQVTGQYLDEEDGNSRAYIHAETSGWNKTLYDAHNNILRSTTEALSAVTGGCDSLTVRPFDEPLQTPGAFSRRIARNSQLILREEAYADKVVDPAAGSYYIETLTDKIAEKAWSEFQEIEKLGGMMKALKQRYIQKEIGKWCRQRDRDIAMRNRVFVGVNQHPNPDEQIDENYHDDRPAFSLHSSNDKEIEGTQQNLAEVLEKQLWEGASVGDLLSLLYQPEKQGPEALLPYRGSQHFEELRLAVERASKTPQVLTVPLGDRKLRAARASFAAGFLGSAGYHIINPVGFTSIDEAVDAVREHSPEIAVLCSSDEEYQALVEPFCKALEKLPEKPIAVLAGYPEKQLDRYRKAGIATFIHRNSNILETLIDFHKKLGIPNRE